MYSELKARLVTSVLEGLDADALEEAGVSEIRFGDIGLAAAALDVV